MANFNGSKYVKDKPLPKALYGPQTEETKPVNVGGWDMLFIAAGAVVVLLATAVTSIYIGLRIVQ